MIDIHCHILPGLDDGATHIEESIDMARQAVEQGIHTVVATPHHKTVRYNNERLTVVEAVEQLNARLHMEGVPLKVLPGQEIRIFEHMSYRFDQSELLTLNDTGTYVLIELPSNEIPRYTDYLIYNLVEEGYTPIIAHPERNKVILDNPDILYEFIKSGALSQVTASSLIGEAGKKIRTFSQALIKHDLAHVIASDAHRSDYRVFNLKEAYQHVKKRMGIKYLRALQLNADDVLNGNPIYSPKPTRIKSKGLFGFIT